MYVDAKSAERNDRLCENLCTSFDTLDERLNSSVATILFPLVVSIACPESVEGSNHERIFTQPDAAFGSFQQPASCYFKVALILRVMLKSNTCSGSTGCLGFARTEASAIIWRCISSLTAPSSRKAGPAAS